MDCTPGWFRGILLLCAMLLLAGCGSSNKPRAIKADPLFSYNIARVPLDWPLEDRDWSENPLIAKHQQQVFEEHGAPDFFYLMWRPDGRPVTTQEVNTASWIHRDRKDKPFTVAPEIAWIYLEDDLFVRFNQRGPDKENLSDMIRVMCDYGDPNDIKESIDVAGQPNLIYTYYQEGKIFYFRDGVQYKEENQPRLEGFYNRR